MGPFRTFGIVATISTFSVSPAFAAKVDTDSGEGCFGVGCFDGEVIVPDVEPVEEDAVLPEDVCETVADRIYRLCLAGPDASASACATDRAIALNRCENPADHVENPVDEVDADDFQKPPPGPTSRGVYRIPYRDGTEIKVMNAYLEHTPSGKIDMRAKGAAGQAIVAAASGTVRIIEDSRSKRQNFINWLRDGPCMNNFVWIEHDTGEWSKYSHMLHGSTTGKAGLTIGERVEEGAYLGDEGNVGCATSAHLHFEVVVPDFRSDLFDPARPQAHFEPGSGSLRGDPYRRRNRNPRICGITTTTFQDGKSYTAVPGPGSVEPVDGEIVRHGMPFRNYACLVQRGILSGYQATWLDFFTIDGEIFVNVVMRPKTGAWASRTGLDAAAFLAENEILKALGYRLSQIESYRTDQVRYAGIWEERGSPAQQVYINKTAVEHQAEVDRLTLLGYRPRAMAVVDDGGLRYSAVWELVSGGWKLRSTLTLAEYADAVRENAAIGWDVTSVNTYDNGGVPYFAAIWHPAEGKSRLRTDLGKAEFGDERSAALTLGLHTVAVTAHEANGHGRYTGVFRE